MITENREAPKVLFTSLPDYPLQRTSRGSSSCVTHQGREKNPPFSHGKVEPWQEKNIKMLLNCICKYNFG
ncbi:hypothetical protein MAN88_04880 [Microcystis aeruginosa]|nr:hypothetical protein MAN88_04880 [Microcystis aeruginosa]